MPGALASQQFLRFDEVILPAPWPAVIAVAMVAAFWSLGFVVARWLRRDASVLDAAAGFIAVTAGVAAIVQALGLAGAAGRDTLRPLGAVLILSNALWYSPASRRWLHRKRAAAVLLVRQASRLERCLLAGSALTVAALGLASLGPPTDIDTIAYHLSVPLEWLARGAIEPSPYWLVARLVGVGEALNLLGLAMGSDCFGSLLQVAGLVAAAGAVASVATSAANRALAIAVVAGCPAAIYLSLTAKPQLLPAAASAIALSLFALHRRAAGYLSGPHLWLVFACTSFAAASKYSFLPTAALLTVVVAWSVWTTRWRTTAVIAAASTFAVIALPVYGRNLVFYGDPFSPILEPFRAAPDAAVMAFRWYLRNFSGDHSVDRLIRLPWDLVVATSPGQLTTVLGFGALAGLTVPLRRRTDWILMGAAGAAVVLSLPGQLQARFFFEAYLWLAVAAAAAPWTPRKRLLAIVLAVQFVVTVPVAAYGATRLFPAAVSNQLREQALLMMASDYRLAQWLDAVLPADAVVATDRHTSLFLPRRATHSDYLSLLRYSPEASTVGQRAAELIRVSGATVLLVTEPAAASPFAALAAGMGRPDLVSPAFHDAVRNPWRQGPAYRVRLYHLAAGRPTTEAGPSP